MDDPTVDGLVRLETEVWEALAGGDAKAESLILADDFLGVYPSGFADKAEHTAQLSDGPTVASYALSEARIRVLSDDAVLLCYRADWQRLRAGSAADSETMFVSSLWCRRDAGWVNVFSQDTPAESPARPQVGD